MTVFDIAMEVLTEHRMDDDMTDTTFSVFCPGILREHLLSPVTSRQRTSMPYLHD